MRGWDGRDSGVTAGDEKYRTLRYGDIVGGNCVQLRVDMWRRGILEPSERVIE